MNFEAHTHKAVGDLRGTEDEQRRCDRLLFICIKTIMAECRAHCLWEMEAPAGHYTLHQPDATRCETEHSVCVCVCVLCVCVCIYTVCVFCLFLNIFSIERKNLENNKKNLHFFSQSYRFFPMFFVVFLRFYRFTVIQSLHSYWFCLWHLL